MFCNSEAWTAASHRFRLIYNNLHIVELDCGCDMIETARLKLKLKQTLMEKFICASEPGRIV